MIFQTNCGVLIDYDQSDKSKYWWFVYADAGKIVREGVAETLFRATIDARRNLDEILLSQFKDLRTQHPGA